MHRSGTSMVAGILTKLGINMGGRRLDRNRCPGNPLGHYEDRAFIRLNDNILKRAGGDWKKPPKWKLIINQRERFDIRIKRVLNSLNYPLTGWKDPRTSLTIDLYYPHLINPYFIVCHRNPDDVARSLLKRDGISLREGKIIQNIYEKFIEHFFKIHSDLLRLDLQYEKVTTDPENLVREIIKFTGINNTHKYFKNAANFVLTNQRAHKLAERLKLKKK